MPSPPTFRASLTLYQEMVDKLTAAIPMEGVAHYLAAPALPLLGAGPHAAPDHRGAGATGESKVTINDFLIDRLRSALGGQHFESQLGRRPIELRTSHQACPQPLRLGLTVDPLAIISHLLEHFMQPVKQSLHPVAHTSGHKALIIGGALAD